VITMSLFLNYARCRYMIYRILLRIKMGKKNRDDYLRKKGTSIVDFLPNRPYMLKGGAKAFVRRGTSDFSVLFLSLEPELEQHLFMNENETFVDVGANVGICALTVASNYADKGINIIAIEAHPDNYKSLCRNIECNNYKIKSVIRTVNKVVTDHTGVVPLFERTSDGSHVGTSLYSLLDTFVHSSNTVKRNGRILQLDCDTLDNILEGQNPDVLSMDIEGAEILALKGASKTLKSLRKIIVEIHGNNSEAVQQLLHANGFETKIIAKSMTYIIGSKPLRDK
jgi:FkbM family methyltransferase